MSRPFARQAVSAAVGVKKPLTAQEEIANFKATPSGRNSQETIGQRMMAGVGLKQRITASSDADLAVYSGKGFLYRGVAQKEQARRAGVATEQAAVNQAAETTRQRNEQQQAMLNLQQESANLAANGGADLKGDATAVNIVAGGTADAEGSTDATVKKKKSSGTGMATQLGINV